MELPWLNSYAPGVPFSLKYPDLPLQTLLEDAARNWGHHPATVCFESRTTYGEMLTKARQFAHALDALGVKRGGRVGMLLPNVPEYVMAIFGSWMAGATVVQLSPLMVEEEIAKLLDQTGCRVVVTLDMLSPPLKHLLGKSPLEHLVIASLEQRLGLIERWLYPIALVRRGVSLRNGRDRRVIEFEQLIASQPTHTPRVRIQPDRDAAIIQPTGGTTGSAKCVVLTHRNLLANTLQLRAWTQTAEAADGVMAVVPFFHCYGLTAVMLGAVAAADTMVLCPKFKPRTLAKLIEQHRPTLLPAVPALYSQMNAYMKDHPTDLSSINLSVSAASALTDEIRREFEGHGARNLIEAYGLSEAGPATHVNPVIREMLYPNASPAAREAQRLDRPGTVGLPLPDTIARIVDLETGSREMSIGEPGELIIHGPQVMSGYLDDAAATAHAIRDGWLFTGDIATRDADGFFKIVDRKKDLIKTSGYNVFPLEVEEVIRRHPAVSDVAVVGMPDADKGELVKAFVIPRANSSLTAAALDQFCREHLAKHKQPRTIELCTELPRNFLGKVLRRRLREDTSVATPSAAAGS